jgi:lipopolysaccharide transport system ATP-binding protein
VNSEIVLKIENISKLYRLGTVGTGTFGGDVQRFWKTKILGQEDPFLKVGQTNDRTSKEKAEFVWALQDINFEVKRGEVLGIIGKNGAGKSTLLKLLSRITSPTTGTIKSAGRMASLLEVGTGFHPELTGRENIFLNGAILGMTKREIQSKFDEIVDFSGCELYIDTPSKRYSSGMTVRLGFAVAAFLDPEILVVDEVLAVGDAEFQKKAIGKMQDVSRGEGKTVLFVSHNMASVKALCNKGMVMNNGKISHIGEIGGSIDYYLDLNKGSKNQDYCFELPNDKDSDVYLKGAYLCGVDGKKKPNYEINEDVIICLDISCKGLVPGLYGYLTISNNNEIIIIEGDTKEYGTNDFSEMKIGKNSYLLKIPRFTLPHGDMFVYLNLASSQANQFNVDSPGHILKFNITDNITTRNTRRSAMTSQILKWELIND